MKNTRFINPSGFPENLPAEQLVEDALKETFAKTAASYGYTHLETASIEYMDTLASKGDVSKEIYTIGRALAEGDSSEEADRGLHFDLTVPFARYVAQHQGELWFPYRRFQVQKVWRGERPQKGRFREFYQADVDVVARENLAIAFDAEIAVVMASVIETFGIGSVTMHINNRKLLNGLFAALGITAATEALQAIDKLDKIGEGAVRELLRELHVADSAIDALFGFMLKPVELGAVAAYLDTLPSESPELEEGKAEVREVFAILATTTNTPNVRFILNPKIARGLDYYTGTVFETTIDGLEKYGSICSGGRYADLASRFTNQKLPGVGMSIGLTRLISILKAESLKDFGAKSPVRVLMCLVNETQLIPSLMAASTLRTSGYATEMNYKHSVGLGKQIEQAKERGIPYALVAEADGKFTLFDIVNEQKDVFVSIEEVSAKL
jgi:histidyl-tRNA synthetase